LVSGVFGFGVLGFGFWVLGFGFGFWIWGFVYTSAITSSTFRYGANSAHIRQSGPDSGPGSRVQVLEIFQAVLFLFARERLFSSLSENVFLVPRLKHLRGRNPHSIQITTHSWRAAISSQRQLFPSILSKRERFPVQIIKYVGAF